MQCLKGEISFITASSVTIASCNLVKGIEVDLKNDYPDINGYRSMVEIFRPDGLNLEEFSTKFDKHYKENRFDL